MQCSAGALDAAIAIAFLAGSCATIDVGIGRCIVSGQRTIAVLKSEERGFDAVLLRYQVAYASARDQFLSLEHTAQQQPDNDQHDSDFDKGEALSVAFHLVPPSVFI